MRVLALTSYSRQGASSRLRVYQFESVLRARGIECDIQPLLSDEYLALRYKRPWLARLRGISAMLGRIKTVLSHKNYDVVWLQREALPWFPSFLERWLHYRSVPFIVDYDDAIFHRYDAHTSPLVRRLYGKKIDNIMKMSEAVVVGNSYLGQRAEAAGAKCVVKIPTVIDSNRYSPAHSRRASEVLNVGWIGTPVTAKFIELIENPLREAARQISLKFITIGAGDYRIEGVEVENLEWSEDSEVLSLQRFDIGVMPLEDALWERGKCGYKIIQYMACSVPAIASPVGVNSELISSGTDGWLATTPAEWLNCLIAAGKDRSKLADMGRSGREKVENSYTVDAVIEELAQVFEQVGISRVRQ